MQVVGTFSASKRKALIYIYIYIFPDLKLHTKSLGVSHIVALRHLHLLYVNVVI